ncbi:MAG: hypothetical protein IPO59_17285 [Betaproteobacteria bacterium]|nr:hypothetical protein [Betaproteobacteria bacterium]
MGNFALEMEPLMSAAQAVQVERKSALIHVGFWRPTIAEVEAIAARFPNSLILSDSAVGALCEHVSAGAAAIGCVRGVAFRLALDEHTPPNAAAEVMNTAKDERQPSGASETADANDHVPGRWVTGVVFDELITGEASVRLGHRR